MTEVLAKQSCEACSAGAPALADADIDAALQQLPGWKLSSSEGSKLLEKDYSFSDFVTAVAFANQIADIAEAANHHPALTIEWGKVKVQWWTHKIGGIHKNDTIMAAKTEQLYPA